jgi:hypothetical protein
MERHLRQSSRQVCHLRLDSGIGSMRPKTGHCYGSPGPNDVVIMIVLGLGRHNWVPGPNCVVLEIVPGLGDPVESTLVSLGSPRPRNISLLTK